MAGFGATSDHRRGDARGKNDFPHGCLLLMCLFVRAGRWREARRALVARPRTIMGSPHDGSVSCRASARVSARYDGLAQGQVRGVAGVSPR